jgi:hypothetical protein
MRYFIRYSPALIFTEDSEFSVFNPPSGQQCLQYAQSYINSVGGYINNPNATSACQYCAYAKGDDFYKPVGISFDNRWRDLGIFIGFLTFNVIVVSVFIPLTLMFLVSFFFLIHSSISVRRLSRLSCSASRGDKAGNIQHLNLSSPAPYPCPRPNK